MPKRRTWEERYRENIRKEQRTMEEFAAHEVEWAEHLFQWCRSKKVEPTEDEYRGAAYFINREFQRKQESLALLFLTDKRVFEELKNSTCEDGFESLRYRYRRYGEVLKLRGI